MTDSMEGKMLGLCKGEFIKGAFGEIFITNQLRFIYHCSECRVKFITMIAFKKHWHSKHASTFEELNETPLNAKLEQVSESIMNNDPLDENTTKTEYSKTTAKVRQEDISMEDFLLDNSTNTNHDIHENGVHRVNTRSHKLTYKVEEPVAETFECTECDEIFTKKNLLYLHKVKHNSKLRSPVLPTYECTQCNEVFTKKNSLTSHKRKHNLTCNDCKKCFTCDKDLKMHAMLHKGKPPHLCSWCGKSFTKKNLVRLHERIHTNTRPYKCPYCSKDFRSNKNFKDHVVVHTKERAHVCNVCNSTFPRRKALKSHMAIHENKKEHVCNICKAAYNQRPALYFHMKHKHNLLKNQPISY